jgi:hypothetical protein
MTRQRPHRPPRRAAVPPQLRAAPAHCRCNERLAPSRSARYKRLISLHWCPAAVRRPFRGSRCKPFPHTMVGNFPPTPVSRELARRRCPLRKLLHPLAAAGRSGGGGRARGGAGRGGGRHGRRAGRDPRRGGDGGGGRAADPRPGRRRRPPRPSWSARAPTTGWRWSWCAPARPTTSRSRETWRRCGRRWATAPAAATRARPAGGWPRPSGTPSTSGSIIGKSAQLRAALDRAARIIPRDRATILVTGETGTGKELMAQAIHYNGPRGAAPFVELNCAAVPAGLLESELFGFEKGAFTDARTAKPGLFEAADEGRPLPGRDRRPPAHAAGEDPEGAGGEGGAPVGAVRARRWTCASSPPRTWTWRGRSSAASSARTCTTA